MDNEPEVDPARELVHQINNLIGVIYAQSAVARADGGADRALEALDLIEAAAKATDERVRAFRRARGR